MSAGEETQKVAGKWNTWILIKYPQKEKLELIKRIEKGSRNLIDIESLSSKFETCFKINVNTRAGRTDYREGEEIQFDILSERDCYIAVFDHRSDGSSILVYPNRWSLNMMIPANQMLTLPIQERDKFKFVVTPPFGDDVIQVIGCTQKSLLFERISKEVQTGSGNVTAVERGMIVRGLSENTTRSMDQKTEWSEKHFVISTFK